MHELMERWMEGFQEGRKEGRKDGKKRGKKKRIWMDGRFNVIEIRSFLLFHAGLKPVYSF